MRVLVHFALVNWSFAGLFMVIPAELLHSSALTLAGLCWAAEVQWVALSNFCDCFGKDQKDILLMILVGLCPNSPHWDPLEKLRALASSKWGLCGIWLQFGCGNQPPRWPSMTPAYQYSCPMYVVPCYITPGLIFISSKIQHVSEPGSSSSRAFGWPPLGPTSWPKPYQRAGARTTQMPDPQKLCVIISIYCLKLLKFWLFCYTTVDNQYIKLEIPLGWGTLRHCSFPEPHLSSQK